MFFQLEEEITLSSKYVSFLALPNFDTKHGDEALFPVWSSAQTFRSLLTNSLDVVTLVIERQRSCKDHYFLIDTNQMCGTPYKGGGEQISKVNPPID